MAWKKAQECRINTKMWVFYNKYRAFYEAWGNQRDDRKVFCNIYEQIVKANEHMKKVNCNYINVAMIKAQEEDEETMDSILSRWVVE
tara:strand:+ start:295 stop:555 length:261 start_codon:yes stop_codon:yes gene_type:complete